jgi:hypothetical protein
MGTCRGRNFDLVNKIQQLSGRTRPKIELVFC